MTSPTNNQLVKRTDINLDDYTPRQFMGLMLMPADQLTSNLVGKIKQLNDNQTKVFFELTPREQNDQNLEEIMNLEITDREVRLLQNVNPDSRDYRMLQDLRNTPPEQTKVFTELHPLFQNFDNLQKVKKLLTPSFSEHHWDSLIHIFSDYRNIESLQKVTALTEAQAQVFAATQEPYFQPRKAFEILDLVLRQKITKEQANAFTAMPFYYRTVKTLQAILDLTPSELKTFNNLEHDKKVESLEKKTGMSKIKAYDLVDGQQGAQYKDRLKKVNLTPSQLKAWSTLDKRHRTIVKLEGTAKLTEAQTEVFNTLHDVEKNYETLIAISKLTDRKAKALNHLRTSSKSIHIKDVAKLNEAQATAFSILPLDEATPQNLTSITKIPKITDAQARAFTKITDTRDLKALEKITKLNEEQADLFAGLHQQISSLQTLAVVAELTELQIKAFKSLNFADDVSTSSMRTAAKLTPPQS